MRQKSPIFSVCVFTLVAATVAARPISGQTPSAKTSTTPASYDVMSIRQNKTTDSRNSSHAGSDDRYSSTNVSLKSVLAKMFNIKEDLIFGIPTPIDSARFDIEAKIADPDPAVLKEMTQEQHRIMLLPLLSERFQLKTHVEMRTLRVYDLVIAKSGLKFAQSADQTKLGSGMSGRGDGKNLKYTFQGMPMSSLTNLLTDRIHRPVIDRTGLAGYYDIALTWEKNRSTEGQDELSSLLTAVGDQLGLKLEPAKGPVETLVVDHVVMPSEN